MVETVSKVTILALKNFVICRDFAVIFTYVVRLIKTRHRCFQAKDTLRLQA